ncbi:MAG: hypothetical protein JWP03_5493 [Phycisphaerales bacterium]|nr:hypothetical protein [Phycisphaerales bacterium]
MDPGPTIEPGGEPEKPPLNYRAARDDRRRKYEADALAIGGAVLAGGTVGGLAFVWIISTLFFGSSYASRPPLNWEVPGLLTAVAVIGWGWLLFFRRPPRSFVLGSLVGLGIAILIAGACFGVNR